MILKHPNVCVPSFGITSAFRAASHQRPWQRTVPPTFSFLSPEPHTGPCLSVRTTAHSGRVVEYHSLWSLCLYPLFTAHTCTNPPQQKTLARHIHVRSAQGFVHLSIWHSHAPTALLVHSCINMSKLWPSCCCFHIPHSRSALW